MKNKVRITITISNYEDEYGIYFKLIDSILDMIIYSQTNIIGNVYTDLQRYKPLVLSFDTYPDNAYDIYASEIVKDKINIDESMSKSKYRITDLSFTLYLIEQMIKSTKEGTKTRITWTEKEKDFNHIKTF